MWDKDQNWHHLQHALSTSAATKSDTISLWFCSGAQPPCFMSKMLHSLVAEHYHVVSSGSMKKHGLSVVKPTCCRSWRTWTLTLAPIFGPTSNNSKVAKQSAIHCHIVTAVTTGVGACFCSSPVGLVVSSLCVRVCVCVGGPVCVNHLSSYTCEAKSDLKLTFSTVNFASGLRSSKQLKMSADHDATVSCSVMNSPVPVLGAY